MSQLSITETGVKDSAILDKCAVHVVEKGGVPAAVAYGPVFLSDNILAVSPNSYQASKNGAVVRVSDGGSVVFQYGAVMAQQGAVSALHVEAGGSVSNAIVQNGASLTVASGGHIGQAVVIEEGGIATICGGSGGTVELHGNSNIGLSITGTKNINLRIKGFTKNRRGDSGCITLPDIQAADVVGVFYPDDNHVTLEMRHGENLTIFIEGIKKHACNTVADKMAQHKREVCFLAGALLRTPQGDKPVETLRYGDIICTYNWQKKLWEKQEIVWAGHRTTHVRPNLPDDEAGYPVRILKDALADVEPVHADLAKRALLHDNPMRMPPLEITTDPALHLVTDKGQTISKARKIGSVVMFMVPTDVRGIRIVSRTSRPADSIGPFVNDRRTRGILISDITYLDTASSRLLNAHLNETELDGWALLDDKAARWTKGNAFLPLPQCGPMGFAMLSFRVLAGGPYIMAPFHKTGSSQFSALGQKPYVA